MVKCLVKIGHQVQKACNSLKKRPRVIQQIRGPNFSQFWPPNTLEWTIGALYLLKVRYFRNVVLVSSISYKKRTKKRRIVVKFVCFLEEFTAWQFAFQIIWPLTKKRTTKKEFDERWPKCIFKEKTDIEDSRPLHARGISKRRE